ncbi:MAG: transglutaminase domain-containing protein [Calditrichaeota bacterium]|nr:transglutaminase domain-containing protein [Calditrichota bacterium]MBT7788829.1 transglutaminase domain-containing protein [Calditrichota bacterium]
MFTKKHNFTLTYFKMLLMFFFIASSLVLTPTTNADDLDSLLSIQQERGGEFAKDIFHFADEARRNGLTPEETEDFRFLVAYLPLSDMAGMSTEDLYENVRLARVALNRFSWGDIVPEDLYRHFVLPHRISQEPFVKGWREAFLEELSPRVESMTMTDAALEVNHWCHENATFKQSSGRDQDPLTTIRAGLGRCEEEMILTIAAMRSIGIPARQCYTPYWAHSDNNHAWVEVWADGKWEHLGGCEPKPSLSDAWFSRSAGRAMLVVSTAYGDYQGNEQVLRRYGNSTLINSTGVYGITKPLKVSLNNPDGTPVVDQRVIFNLFNYGAFMPALSLNTDSTGSCNLNCGSGTWIISAGTDELSAVSITDPENQYADMVLSEKGQLQILLDVEYTPPPPLPPIESKGQDSLFSVRLQEEKTIREGHFWKVWMEDAGLSCSDSIILIPDSTFSQPIMSLAAPDSTDLLDILKNSRGNWGLIYRFLTESYPAVSRPMAFQGSALPSASELRTRLMLLKQLTIKDLRDFTLEVLEDHYYHSTLEMPLSSSSISEFLNGMSEDVRNRYVENVIKPRIDWEPSIPWREYLIDFLNSNPKLIESKNDKALVTWLKDNIISEEKADRLGSSLSPRMTLELKRGRNRDIERLYIGLCRVRGIPSRFDPVSGQLECWKEDKWQQIQLVILEEEEDSEVKLKGKLFVDFSIDSTFPQDRLAAPDSIDRIAAIGGIDEQIDVNSDGPKKQKYLYLKDWAVQEWAVDHFSVVDFGYQKDYSDIEWPQELPAGLYCLTTGIRKKDGSAPVALKWFEITGDTETHVEMEFK